MSVSSAGVARLSVALTIFFSVLVTISESHAAPANFQLPFACGETWKGATYDPEHGYTTYHKSKYSSTSYYPLDLNHDYGDNWEYGHPVLASAAGTVVTSKWDSYGYGNLIEIDHGGGWKTLYAHLSERKVGLNEKVAAGQHIGGVGNSGTPHVHLHYEQVYNNTLQHITFNGTPVTYSWKYNGNPVKSANCLQQAPMPIPTFHGSDKLQVGGVLRSNEYILSPDGRFMLVHQTDGNLVLYGPGSNALWSSGTSGKTSTHVVMQHDGNLVLYGPSGVLWNTSTGGKGATGLHVQNDGNLVIYNSGIATWSSGTGGRSNSLTLIGSNLLNPDQKLQRGTYIRSQDKRFFLVHQTDGNVVLYGPGHSVVWSSGSGGRSTEYLLMQGDGNLVLYGPSGAVWNSSTSGKGSSYLNLQDDGNLVLYNSYGATWSTGTGGRRNGPKYAGASTLLQDQKLLPNTYLQSLDYRFTFLHQADGNLVLFEPGFRTIWSSGTSGKATGYLLMQSDGNLVLYGPSGALWDSSTSGKGNSYLNIQNDGNSVIYNIYGPTWSTGTGGR